MSYDASTNAMRRRIDAQKEEAMRGKTVLRWGHNRGGMTGWPDGEYVLYADYAALAQRLADVAYLEAWAQGHPDREYGRWGVGVQAYDEDGQRHTAASLPALGARLRQGGTR